MFTILERALCVVFPQVVESFSLAYHLNRLPFSDETTYSILLGRLSFGSFCGKNIFHGILLQFYRFHHNQERSCFGFTFIYVANERQMSECGTYVDPEESRCAQSTVGGVNVDHVFIVASCELNVLYISSVLSFYLIC